MTDARWLPVSGAENMRDLGGLPLTGGGTVRPARLLRSDSLQELTDADVRHLVDDVGVTEVVDLRTGVEVAGEGPGPMHREPSVQVRHLSLLPEPDDGVAVASEDDKPVVLPWNTQERKDAERGRGISGAYLAYLDDRTDSVMDALRIVAHSDGAVIVHCAAGKDRTGTIVALALAEVGVTREAIVDDYVRSAERVEAVIAQLVTRRTYADDLVGDEDVDKHKPRAQTMERLLDALDSGYGGAPGWLRAHGWTDDDATALRARLIGDGTS